MLYAESTGLRLQTAQYLIDANGDRLPFVQPVVLIAAFSMAISHPMDLIQVPFGSEYGKVIYKRLKRERISSSRLRIDLSVENRV